MRRARLIGGLAAPLLAVAACGSASSTTSSGSAAGGGGAISVSAHDFAFDPVSGSVAAGAALTVTFTNKGAAEHSFTVDSPSGAGSVDAEGGKSATLSFSAPGSGSITFHCKYHPQMRGTISVGGAGAATTGGSGSSSSGYGY